MHVAEKIMEELRNLPIDSEARVVYILVQIRKILEHENIRDSALRFYGDWVVHTKLDKYMARKIYIEIKKESNKGNNILSFETLRSELKKFLHSHNIPDDLVVSNDCWSSFREKLIHILVDVPIIHIEQEEIIGRFSFQSSSGNGINFCIEDKNGKILGRIFP